MFSGQIAICMNCGSFVCRSFAFTPKILQPILTLGFAQGTGKGYAQTRRKAILHSFSAT